MPPCSSRTGGPHEGRLEIAHFFLHGGRETEGSRGLSGGKKAACASPKHAMREARCRQASLQQLLLCAFSFVSFLLRSSLRLK